MKRISLITVLITVFSISAYAKMKDSNAVFMEAKDMKWTAVPETPGIQVAVVEGDLKKGNHHAMHKFDAGVVCLCIITAV